MRDAIIARELEQLRAPASERMIDPEESRRLARETPFADSLPHYGVVRTSPAGVIWVVDYTIPPDIGWAATAFRADGAIVGRVESSIRGVPVAFGDDRVVLRSTDDDGVVSLSIHRLIRP